LDERINEIYIFILLIFFFLVMFVHNFHLFSVVIFVQRFSLNLEVRLFKYFCMLSSMNFNIFFIHRSNSLDILLEVCIKMFMSIWIFFFNFEKGYMFRRDV
jgi:hypothetical protein